MQTFGDKLRIARAVKNYSQEDIATFLDVTKQAVSVWEKGLAKPKKESRRKLETFLELNQGELEEDYIEIPNLRPLPILGYATAGLLEEQFEQHLGYVTVPEKYANQTKYMAVKVSGDSMNRYIHDGSIAVFEKYPATINNKIVLVEVNNETTIKRFHDYNTVIMLDPDSTNPVHRPIVIQKENENTIKVYGRLVYFCKEEE